MWQAHLGAGARKAGFCVQPRMNGFLLPGLVKCRAMLAARPRAANAEAARLHADLAAVDAVIRQLDPAYKVDAIPHKLLARRHGERARAPTSCSGFGAGAAAGSSSWRNEWTARRAGRPATWNPSACP